MRQILRTDDLVLLTFVESLLRDAGIEAAVLDRHASALRGAVGMVEPRVVVREDQWRDARTLLMDAGLAKWVIDDGAL